MTTQQPLTRFQRAVSWYKNVADIFTPQRVLLGCGVAAIGIVGLWGGWGDATEAAQTTPVVEVDDTFSATPFAITVKSARVFDEISGPFPPEDGYRYLALVVDVTNTSNEPVSAGIVHDGLVLDAPALRVIELDSGPSPMAPSTVRTVDSLSQRTFQPGVTTNVVLAWQQQTSAAIPEHVTATFSQHTWRRSTLDDVFGWRDPVPAATLTVPVQPLEAA